MTSVSSYYLLGPIKVNEEFILTYSCKNIAYFLTLVKGETGDPDDLIFDPRASGDRNTIFDPLVMTVISTGSDKYGITYVDSSNTTQYITGIQMNNKVCAGSTTKRTGLVFSQTTAAPWPGTPFLAGIGYTINTISNHPIMFKSYIAISGSNGVATSIKMKNGKPFICSTLTTFLVVPTKWFERGNCNSNDNLKCIVNNEILWVAKNNQFKDGFTDIADCRAGVNYTYCPTGKNCSVSCKGPCPSSTEKDVGCFFDVKIKGFKCEIPPVDVPWYQQPWFIIGATLVGLAIIILIIFLVFRFTARD